MTKLPSGESLLISRCLSSYSSSSLNCIGGETNALGRSQLQPFVDCVSGRTVFTESGIRLRFIPIAVKDEGATVAAPPRPKPGSSVRLCRSAAERHGRCCCDVRRVGGLKGCASANHDVRKERTRVWKPSEHKEEWSGLQVSLWSNL